MLPNEGVSVADYISILTGHGLSALLSSPEEVQVNAAIPKFESEYDTEMSGILVGMGVTDAFDPTVADFPVSVIQWMVTFIFPACCTRLILPWMNKERKPGLRQLWKYMLIDCNTNTPILIGTMIDIEN